MFLGCFSSLDYTFWQEYQHRIEPSNMCFHLFLLGVFHSTALRYRRVAFSGSRSTRFLCFVCFFFFGFSGKKSSTSNINNKHTHTHNGPKFMFFKRSSSLLFLCFLSQSLRKDLFSVCVSRWNRIRLKQLDWSSLAGREEKNPTKAGNFRMAIWGGKKR